MSNFVVYLTGAETEAVITTANISNTLSGTTAASITDTWNTTSSQAGTPDVIIEIDWSKHNFMDYMQLRWDPDDEDAVRNTDTDENGKEHKVEYIINKGYRTSNTNSRGFFDYGYSSNANVNPVTEGLNTLALDSSTLNNLGLIAALKNTHSVNDDGVTDAERSPLLVYLTNLATEIFGTAGTLELISNEKTIADEVTNGGSKIANKLNDLINNQNANPLSPNYIVGKLLTGIIGQHLGSALYNRFQNHIEVYKMSNGVFTKYEPKLGDGRFYDVISKYIGIANEEGRLVKADNLPHDLFNFGFRVGDTIRIRLNLVTDDNNNVVFTAVDSNGDEVDSIHSKQLYEFKINLIDDVLELNSGTSDIAKTTNEDTNATGTIAVRYRSTPDLDLLGSGAGEDDSKLHSFSISSQPTNGTASINKKGEWTYVPDLNYNSNDVPTDSFTVLVKDKYGGHLASPLDGHTVSQVITVTVNPINDPPLGSVSLSGTEVVSNQLTASNDITDIDGPNPLSISYQWYRGTSAITDANSSTYDLVDDDAGELIKCVASYTDEDGTIEYVHSAQSNIDRATISIVGTAREDEELTIDYKDHKGANSYQWRRTVTDSNGNPTTTDIPNATSDKYVLVQDDVGKTITVRVGSSKSGVAHVTSPATAPVANVNDDPTGLPTIDGTFVVSNLLTANTDDIADEDGLGNFAYQWKRDGSAIDGANSKTYRLVDDDATTKISVTVSYTDQPHGDNNTGTAESLTSIEYDVEPATIGIVGNEREDEELSVDLKDFDIGTANSYQWKRGDNNISGATSAKYTLVQADVGYLISVTVGTSHSSDDSIIAKTAPATGNILNVNDNPSGAPTIDGTFVVSNLLTANTDDIADEDGLGNFAYQWKRDGSVIAGANSKTYRLVDADANTKISVTVSYTDQPHGDNNTGTAQSLTSQEYDVIQATIRILGNEREDEELSVDLKDFDIGTANSYQWKRTVTENGVSTTSNIATSSTYTLVQADVGNTITVTVGTSHSSEDSIIAKNAPATSQVANVNDPPVGTVSIDGILKHTNVLTANLEDSDGKLLFSDEDGIDTSTITYQWKRDGVAISGAENSTYTLIDDDIGSKISVTVSYTDQPHGDNNTGTVESLTSIEYDVEPATISINGLVQEDEELTIDLGDLQGANEYQWKRGALDIANETNDRYTLVQADVGATITVTVTSSTGATVTSPATTAVANVNDIPVGSITLTGTGIVSYTLEYTYNITDEDGIDGPIEFQWKSGIDNVGDSSSNIYFIKSTDIGKDISVVGSYTDKHDNQHEVVSNPISVVAASVSISGSATQGQTLTAVSNLQGTLSYQWERTVTNSSGNKTTSDIPNASNSTYKLVQDDVNSEISVKVGTNRESGYYIQSSKTDPVVNTNDEPEGKPLITGSSFVSNQLTANVEDDDGNLLFSDEDGINTDTITYQWKRDGEVLDGETASTYNLVSADDSTEITVSVSYVDNFGNTHTVDSLAFTIADYSVSISETAIENYSLTASGVNLAGIVSYRWVRDSDDTEVQNGPSPTYKLVNADIESTITVTVSNDDDDVLPKSKTSATVQPENAATGTVTVTTSDTGKFLVGETYHIDTSDISDADGTLSFAYSTVFQKYDTSSLQWVTAKDNDEDIIETTANIVLDTKHNNLRPVTTVTSTDSRGGVTQLTSVIGKIIVTDPGSQVTNSYTTLTEDVNPPPEDIASTFKSDLFASVGQANANFVVSVSSNNTNLIQFNSATLYNSASNQASDPITFNPELQSDANGEAKATISYSVDDLVRFAEDVSFVVSPVDDDDGAGISVSANYDSSVGTDGSITINFDSSDMIDKVNSYSYQLIYINENDGSITQLFSDADNMRLADGSTESVNIDLGSDADKAAINEAIASIQGDDFILNDAEADVATAQEAVTAAQIAHNTAADEFGFIGLQKEAAENSVESAQIAAAQALSDYNNANQDATDAEAVAANMAAAATAAAGATDDPEALQLVERYQVALGNATSLRGMADVQYENLQDANAAVQTALKNESDANAAYDEALISLTTATDALEGAMSMLASFESALSALQREVAARASSRLEVRIVAEDEHNNFIGTYQMDGVYVFRDAFLVAPLVAEISV